MFFNHRICNWQNDKMALKVMEKDIAETEDIPIVVVTSTDIVFNIKGYHVYKSVWTPTLQEQVYGEIEPHNSVDKYAVAFKKDEKVVGHLLLGENAKFAKTIFYFLRADHYGKCNIRQEREWISVMAMECRCLVFCTYHGKSSWWRY